MGFWPASAVRARDGSRGVWLVTDRELAVASLIVPDHDSLTALASCLLTQGYRLPGTRASQQLRFGVSYARELLERFGPFPADLEIAEDAVMNMRLLSRGIDIELAQEVVTEHAYPATMPGLLRDQFQRGRAQGRLDVPMRIRGALAVGALREAPLGVLRAHQSGVVPPGSWPGLACGLAAGAVTRASGVLLGGSPEAGAAAEVQFRRWAARKRLDRAFGGGGR